MKKYMLLAFFITQVLFVFAQKVTISGFIRDAATGEELVGANVYIKETFLGTSTNKFGFYSLSVEKSNATIVVSYMGYDEFKVVKNLTTDIKLNVELTPTSIEAGEVVVSAKGVDKNIKSVDMGKVEMPIESIKNLPQLMGETDILKIIQLLPGVQSAGEGSTGFYVRGGGPDQNLILLDDAVVYNASHLFGFFSVFNADAVKNIELIKGGMPAQYGGRLSSVLDITMKEGNTKEFHGEGGVGLISSRLTIEGPIVKDKASFIVSGRRTYIDILMKPFISDESRFKGSGYYFYDLNTKFNYRISDKDRIFVSGYFGRDVFSIKSNDGGLNAEIPWGNATLSARWNHLFSDKLFFNNTLVYSTYDFSFGAQLDNFEMKLLSGITDWNVKSNLTWIPNTKHTAKFGVDYIRHKFRPGTMSAKLGAVSINPNDVAEQFAHEFAAYISDEWRPTEKFSLQAGLRATAFMQVGPFKRYLKNEFDTNTDTLVYDKGEEIVTYKHLEPRLAARFVINERSSVKASYTQNYQYIHLASISSGSMPTDLWVPSSELVKPQFGVQYAVGYFLNFAENVYETSLEVYYKTYDNLIEYKDGVTPGDNIGDNTDNAFVFGSGESYGVELFLKKAVGRLNGWVGYTWSKTMRTFPDINFGKTFPAKYDRRHDLSVVLNYDLTKRLNVSAVFVYGTGNAITLPVGRYLVEGNIISEYGMRNDYRMAAYHRADLSATYKLKKGKFFESNLNFSVYNVYNRKNPYFIFFETEGTVQDGDLKTTAKQISLFPVLPSISWNFKF